MRKIKSQILFTIITLLVLITFPLFVISCAAKPKDISGNVNFYVAAVGNANFTMVEKDGHGVILDAGSGLYGNSGSSYAADDTDTHMNTHKQQ